MFCEKQKLTALLNFAATDDERPILKNVRFEGEKAIATDGHILAIAHFPQSQADTPTETPIKPFSVPASVLNDALRVLPKKGIFGRLRGVSVAPNTARVGETVFKGDTEQTYPDYEKHLPIAQPEDAIFSIGIQNMRALVNAMNACGNEGLTLRIPQNGPDGYVVSPVAFETERGEPLTGLVMPRHLRYSGANHESVPVKQSDVADMLALLIELAPENERVSEWIKKYEKTKKA